MIPARYNQIVFSLFLSGMMSFLVTGLATIRLLGFVEGFFGQWLPTWGFAWAVAFPTAVLAAPLARRFAALICRSPKEG